MYGGTAKTYVNWKMLGEPFTENGRLYIMVEHPLTHRPKQVRWYRDEAHHLMMHPVAEDFNQEENFAKVFLFKSTMDSIKYVLDKNVTEEERDAYLRYKWRYADVFGGIWYAATDEEDYTGKASLIDWPTFKNAMKNRTTNPNSLWFKI